MTDTLTSSGNTWSSGLFSAVSNQARITSMMEFSHEYEIVWKTNLQRKTFHYYPKNKCCNVLGRVRMEDGQAYVETIFQFQRLCSVLSVSRRKSNRVWQNLSRIIVYLRRSPPTWRWKNIGEGPHKNGDLVSFGKRWTAITFLTMQFVSRGWNLNQFITLYIRKPYTGILYKSPLVSR